MTHSRSQPNIVERLRSDAGDHRNVAADCDCPPEDTINWQHNLTCLEAADEIERLECAIGAVAFAMGWTDLKEMTVEEYAASLRSELASARKALESIEQYGSDTLSGRADGPDDREWQREGVREMRDRARAALGQPK